MAIERQDVSESEWGRPDWPDPLPDPAAMRLVYSAFADELVVNLADPVDCSPYYAWIATPKYEYAAVKIDGSSGKVIGVMVELLAAHAVSKHPAWQAATEANPPDSVVERVVADIKQLFDQYGLEPEETDHD